ncbi:MAG: cysteine--tRNA ligase [Candidatus Levyibacteriota bacterium]
MSNLLLYNSLTRKKELFKPFKDNAVSIYVCGITPYDTTHLGHAFTYVHFDVLVRYLKFLGYKVNYVQNVTDIDDDILKKAKETGQDWKELGNYWTKQFLKDMKDLSVLPPDHYVKATNSIAMMIRIIRVFLESEHAYSRGGNVYFRVKKFKEYGKLSGYSYSQMVQLLKERGGDPSDPNKENPLDFILWQAKKEQEPFWKSPFGDGRPGWHIECCAMAYRYLGKQIDIHGGGFDLIFPHHESEIAQSESFTGKEPFSRYWMHTAMVKYEKEKMSKSLGNLIMIRNLLKKYSANAVRLAILSQHYRSQWSFKEKEVEAAEKTLSSILLLPYSKKKPDLKKLSKFFSYLNDDLDTKSALGEVLRLAKKDTNASDARAALYILGFSL